GRDGGAVREDRDDAHLLAALEVTGFDIDRVVTGTVSRNHAADIENAFRLGFRLKFEPGEAKVRRYSPRHVDFPGGRGGTNAFCLGRAGNRSAGRLDVSRDCTA